MVKRVACFFTCGHTEAGAMQKFLQKINSNCLFYQCLPNKERVKRENRVLIKQEYEGLTGAGLHKRIYKILERYKDEYRTYDAVLIEDDLDARFANRDQKYIQEYNSEVVERVRNIIGRSDLDVIIVYAAPEVEGWFLSDWDHSFLYVYGSSKNIRDIADDALLRRYVFQLRRLINDEIVQFDDDIENYGSRNRAEETKLSDRLREATEDKVKRRINQSNAFSETEKELINSSGYLFYSKAREGDMMLRQIQPEIVAKKCTHFFATAYRAILEL